MRRFLPTKHTVIVILLLALFTFQSLVSLSVKSATFDEVQYFGIGKYLITDHKWDIMGAILHPPLSYYLNAIPLLFVHEDTSVWQYEVADRNLEFLGSIDYYRGQKLLSSPENRSDRLLIASRLMTLLVSILLGVYVYRFSMLLFGATGGVISLFLFTFCPNMLAFSGICVPDMPVTVFSLISVYYLWRSVDDEKILSSLLAGLFLGFALLSKFTAFQLIPVEVMLASAVMYKTKRNLLPKMLLVFLCAALVLCAGYQFDITPLIQGLRYRMEQQAYGQGVFLMGMYSNHGWWYFYPLTLLMKTPLPLLLLFPLSVYYLVREKDNGFLILLFLLAPMIAIVGAFMFSGYSVALRYLLPVYPFMFVAAGVLSRQVVKLRYLLCIAACWYVTTSLLVAPHYLAYFNEAVGGPGNGYKYLVDSNLDWGQDLKGLKNYMDAHGIDKISLSYFGADSPQRYGINYDWLPSHYLYNPTPDKSADIGRNRYVAVSATNLQGVYLDKRNSYKSLLDYKPVAKIGYSIFVYDLASHEKQ